MSRTTGPSRSGHPTRGRVRLVVEGDGGGVVDLRRGIDGWWSPLELPPRALEPGADYGFLLDDDRHALPRPAFAPTTGRRARAVAHLRRVLAFAWHDQALDRAAAGRIGDLRAAHRHLHRRAAPSTAAIERLDHLRSIGVDLVEVMPVNAFNGTHNWGYDGVGWFARHRAVRRPDRRTSASSTPATRPGWASCRTSSTTTSARRGTTCRSSGRTSSRAATPGATWSTSTARARPRSGGSSSTTLRMWFADYHVDALRLDAVHALVDTSPAHILEEMAVETRRCRPICGRPLTLIAESDLNDARLVTPREAGGYGLDAQWSDDFHHALHVALTGRDVRLLRRLRAAVGAWPRCARRGFFHDGTWSSFRGRDHGAPVDTDHLPTWRLVVSSQNHDQIGNRARGDRLAEHLDDDQLACAALLTLCGPFTPMLFMGEEWAASTPFQFFTSHPEPDLGRGDRRGPARGVRADGLGPVGGPRPAGPGDVRAVDSWTGRSSRPAGTPYSSTCTARLAALRRALPELTDPAFGALAARGRRDFEGVHAAPFGPAAGGELRGPPGVAWRVSGALLFTTPSPRVRDRDRLRAAAARRRAPPSRRDVRSRPPPAATAVVFCCRTGAIARLWRTSGPETAA